MTVKYLIESVGHLPPETVVKVHVEDGGLLRDVEMVRVEKTVPQGEESAYQRVVIFPVAVAEPQR